MKITLFQLPTALKTEREECGENGRKRTEKEKEVIQKERNK
jgi:hypothetical protein